MKQRIATLLVAIAACCLTFGATLAHAQSGGWEFRLDRPGAPSCRAVKLGASVNIQLLRNRTNHMVLVAGHPEWALTGDAFPVTLVIDGGAPATVKGIPLGPVVFMVIEDEAVQKRLMAARAIDLSLRDQHFQADVTGLGAAFDAISICPE